MPDRIRSSSSTRPLLLLAVALASSLLGCERLGSEQGSAGAPQAWEYSEAVAPAQASSAMVSTTDRLGTLAGLRIMEDGGNAVDAAVGISFVLAVVNPEAGNIGGGGFMVIRLADGDTYSLDYRERAPAAATRDMYLDDRGAPTLRSLRGHSAAGVPGSVMGLWEAHQRFGTIEWPVLLEPAIELAQGFEVSERLASSLARAQSSLEDFYATREAFLPGGAPPAIGAIFRQPDLAKTLSRVRDNGPGGFYTGVTADLIVDEMRRADGLITHSDLSGYAAIWREPVSFRYRGHTLHSMAPPSSGGATMALIAQIVEGYDLPSFGRHSTQTVHVLAEASRRAYADRNQALADPDFVEVPLDRMTSRDYARARGADISMSAATPSQQVGPAVLVSEGAETTHVSVVDAMGNAVALTTTLNSLYGSRVTVAGAGFLLNNEMDDFATRPGFPNQFGLVQGERNAIEPGKRMLSAMTPTIVEDRDGELFLVLGSPGGSTIITTVFQTIVNVVDFGMDVSQSVRAPRIHHQHLPDRIQYERGGLLPTVVDSLRTLGHTVEERVGTSGDVQAILVLPDGTLSGYSDPRRGGWAAGF